MPESDEHLRRSPECAFFTFSALPKTKAGRPRKSRTSKASRMSTQSSITPVSEGTDFADIVINEDESIAISTEEVEKHSKIAKGSKKASKVKKLPVKSKLKTASMMADESALASSFIEPEDDDFKVKVHAPASKKGRNKKRSSDEMNEESDAPQENPFLPEDSGPQAPPPKRRATRTRTCSMQASFEPDPASKITPKIDTNLEDTASMLPPAAPASNGAKRGRKSGSSTLRKASVTSTASIASLRSALPDDNEIDAALEADLDRPLTDDEMDIEYPEIQQPKTRRLTRTRPGSRNGAASLARVRRTTRVSTVSREDVNRGKQNIPLKDVYQNEHERISSGVPNTCSHAVFNGIVSKSERTKEEELKSGSPNPPASTGKVVDAKVIISVKIPKIQTNLVPPKPKGPRSRQPSRQVPGRNVSKPVSPALENVAIVIPSIRSSILRVPIGGDDSGNETDIDVASQVPKKRGVKKGVTITKKKKVGKKTGFIDGRVEDISQPEAGETDLHHGEDIAITIATDVAPSPKQNIVELKLPGENSSLERESARETTPAGVQLAFETSSLSHNDTDGIGVRSPSQSAPPTDNANGSSDPTELVHESTPQPVELLLDISKQLPSLKTTPPPIVSPQSSDVENQPPSSRPSSTRPPLSVNSPYKSQMTRMPSATCTPTASPSKRNCSKLQSSIPWVPVEFDKFLGLSMDGKENNPFATGGMIEGLKDRLPSPEKILTMEEWVRFKARALEETMRNDCERLVGKFEGEGIQALRTLEGIVCVD